METYRAFASLGEESSQMWSLNKRLESYLARVKSLEEENEMLREEIHRLKSTRSESSLVRKYHEEIMKLRDALDDSHQEMIQVEMARDDIRQEIQYVKELCLQEQQARQDVTKELSESQKILEEEQRAQTWLKDRLVQLQEELGDILNTHEEEKALMEEEISSYSQRLGNFKLAPVAFQPVNVEDYASKLSQIWQGAVEEYKNEVSALETNLSQVRENLRKVVDENKQSQQHLQNLDRELQSLKERKDLLEELLSQQWLDQQEEEGRLQLEIEALEKEKQDLRVQIARVLEDRQQLMHLKMSLSLEVATYRSMLEAESTRIYSPSVDNKVSSSFNESVLERKALRKRQAESRDYRLYSNKKQSAESSTPNRYLNVKDTSSSSRASPVTKEFQKVSSVLQSQSQKYTKASSAKAATPLSSVESNLQSGAPTVDVLRKSKVENISHSYTRDSSKAVTEETVKNDIKDYFIPNGNTYDTIDPKLKDTEFLGGVEGTQYETDLLESSLNTIEKHNQVIYDFVAESQQNSLKVQNEDDDTQFYETPHKDKSRLDVPQAVIDSPCEGFEKVLAGHFNETHENVREIVVCQKVYFEKQEIVESLLCQNNETTIKGNVEGPGKVVDIKDQITADTDDSLASSQVKEPEETSSVETEEPKLFPSDCVSVNGLASSKDDFNGSASSEHVVGSLSDLTENINQWANREEPLQINEDVDIIVAEQDTSSLKQVGTASDLQEEEVTLCQQFHGLSALKENSNQLFDNEKDIKRESQDEDKLRDVQQKSEHSEEVSMDLSDLEYVRESSRKDDVSEGPHSLDIKHVVDQWTDVNQETTQLDKGFELSDAEAHLSEEVAIYQEVHVLSLRKEDTQLIDKEKQKEEDEHEFNYEDQENADRNTEKESHNMENTDHLSEIDNDHLRDTEAAVSFLLESKDLSRTGGEKEQEDQAVLTTEKYSATEDNEVTQQSVGNDSDVIEDNESTQTLAAQDSQLPENETDIELVSHTLEVTKPEASNDHLSDTEAKISSQDEKVEKLNQLGGETEIIKESFEIVEEVKQSVQKENDIEQCIAEDSSLLASTESQSQLLGHEAEESLIRSDNTETDSQLYEPEPITQDDSQAFTDRNIEEELEASNMDNVNQLSEVVNDHRRDTIATVSFLLESEDLSQTGEEKEQEDQVDLTTEDYSAPEDTEVIQQSVGSDSDVAVENGSTQTLAAQDSQIPENETEVEPDSHNVDIHEPVPSNDHLGDTEAEISSQQEKDENVNQLGGETEIIKESFEIVEEAKQSVPEEHDINQCIAEDRFLLTSTESQIQFLGHEAEESLFRSDNTESDSQINEPEPILQGDSEVCTDRNTEEELKANNVVNTDQVPELDTDHLRDTVKAVSFLLENKDLSQTGGEKEQNGYLVPTIEEYSAPEDTEVIHHSVGNDSDVVENYESTQIYASQDSQLPENESEVEPDSHNVHILEPVPDNDHIEAEISSQQEKDEKLNQLSGETEIIQENFEIVEEAKQSVPKEYDIEQCTAEEDSDLLTSTELQSQLLEHEAEESLIRRDSTENDSQRNEPEPIIQDDSQVCTDRNTEEELEANNMDNADQVPEVDNDHLIDTKATVSSQLESEDLSQTGGEKEQEDQVVLKTEDYSAPEDTEVSQQSVGSDSDLAEDNGTTHKFAAQDRQLPENETKVEPDSHNVDILEPVPNNEHLGDTEAKISSHQEKDEHLNQLGGETEIIQENIEIVEEAKQTGQNDYDTEQCIAEEDRSLLTSTDSQSEFLGHEAETDSQLIETEPIIKGDSEAPTDRNIEEELEINNMDNADQAPEDDNDHLRDTEATVSFLLESKYLSQTDGEKGQEDQGVFRTEEYSAPEDNDVVKQSVGNASDIAEDSESTQTHAAQDSQLPENETEVELVSHTMKVLEQVPYNDHLSDTEAEKDEHLNQLGGETEIIQESFEIVQEAKQSVPKEYDTEQCIAEEYSSLLRSTESQSQLLGHEAEESLIKSDNMETDSQLNEPEPIIQEDSEMSTDRNTEKELESQNVENTSQVSEVDSDHLRDTDATVSFLQESEDLGQTGEEKEQENKVVFTTEDYSAPEDTEVIQQSVGNDSDVVENNEATQIHAAKDSQLPENETNVELVSHIGEVPAPEPDNDNLGDIEAKISSEQEKDEHLNQLGGETEIIQESFEIVEEAKQSVQKEHDIVQYIAEEKSLLTSMESQSQLLGHDAVESLIRTDNTETDSQLNEPEPIIQDDSEACTDRNIEEELEDNNMDNVDQVPEVVSDHLRETKPTVSSQLESEDLSQTDGEKEQKAQIVLKTEEYSAPEDTEVIQQSTGNDSDVVEDNGTTQTHVTQDRQLSENETEVEPDSHNVDILEPVPNNDHLGDTEAEISSQQEKGEKLNQLGGETEIIKESFQIVEEAKQSVPNEYEIEQCIAEEDSSLLTSTESQSQLLGHEAEESLIRSDNTESDSQLNEPEPIIQDNSQACTDRNTEKELESHIVENTSQVSEVAKDHLRDDRNIEKELEANSIDNADQVPEVVNDDMRDTKATVSFLLESEDLSHTSGEKEQEDQVVLTTEDYSTPEDTEVIQQSTGNDFDVVEDNRTIQTREAQDSQLPENETEVEPDSHNLDILESGPINDHLGDTEVEISSQQEKDEKLNQLGGETEIIQERFEIVEETKQSIQKEHDIEHCIAEEDSSLLTSTESQSQFLGQEAEENLIRSDSTETDSQLNEPEPIIQDVPQACTDRNIEEELEVNEMDNADQVPEVVNDHLRDTKATVSFLVESEYLRQTGGEKEQEDQIALTTEDYSATEDNEVIQQSVGSDSDVVEDNGTTQTHAAQDSQLSENETEVEPDCHNVDILELVPDNDHLDDTEVEISSQQEKDENVNQLGGETEIIQESFQIVEEAKQSVQKEHDIDQCITEEDSSLLTSTESQSELLGHEAEGSDKTETDSQFNEPEPITQDDSEACTDRNIEEELEAINMDNADQVPEVVNDHLRDTKATVSFPPESEDLSQTGVEKEQENQVVLTTEDYSAPEDTEVIQQSVGSDSDVVVDNGSTQTDAVQDSQLPENETEVEPDSHNVENLEPVPDNDHLGDTEAEISSQQEKDEKLNQLGGETEEIQESCEVVEEAKQSVQKEHDIEQCIAEEHSSLLTSTESQSQFLGHDAEESLVRSDNTESDSQLNEPEPNIQEDSQACTDRNTEEEMEANKMDNADQVPEIVNDHLRDTKATVSFQLESEGLSQTGGEKEQEDQAALTTEDYSAPEDTEVIQQSVGSDSDIVVDNGSTQTHAVQESQLPENETEVEPDSHKLDNLEPVPDNDHLGDTEAEISSQQEKDEKLNQLGGETEEIQESCEVVEEAKQSIQKEYDIEQCIAEEDSSLLTSTESQSQFLGHEAVESLVRSDNTDSDSQFNESEPIIQDVSEACTDMNTEKELEANNKDNADQVPEVVNDDLRDTKATVSFLLESEDLSHTSGEKEQEAQVALTTEDYSAPEDTEVIQQSVGIESDVVGDNGSTQTHAAQDRQLSENETEVELVSQKLEDHELVPDNDHHSDSEAKISSQQEKDEPLNQADVETELSQENYEIVKQSVQNDFDVVEDNESTETHEAPDSQLPENETAVELECHNMDFRADILVEQKKSQELLEDNLPGILDVEGLTGHQEEFECIPTDNNQTDEPSISDESLCSQDISICSQKSEDFEISKDYQLEQTLPDATPLPNLDDEFDELADTEVMSASEQLEDVAEPQVPEYTEQNVQGEQVSDSSLESQTPQRITGENEQSSLCKQDKANNIETEYKDQEAERPKVYLETEDVDTFEQQKQEPDFLAENLSEALDDDKSVLEQHNQYEELAVSTLENETSESEESVNSQEEVSMFSPQSEFKKSKDNRSEQTLLDMTPSPDLTEKVEKLAEDQLQLTPQPEQCLIADGGANEKICLTEGTELVSPEHCEAELLSDADTTPVDTTVALNRDLTFSGGNSDSTEKEDCLIKNKTDLEQGTALDSDNNRTEHSNEVNIKDLDQNESKEGDLELTDVDMEKETATELFHEVKDDNRTSAHIILSEESEIQYKISVDNPHEDVVENIISESEVSSDESSPNVSTVHDVLELENERDKITEEDYHGIKVVQISEDTYEGETSTYEPVPSSSASEPQTSDDDKDTTGESSDSSLDSYSAFDRGAVQECKAVSERETEHQIDTNRVNGLHKHTIVQATLDLEDHLFNGHSKKQCSEIVISERKTIVTWEDDTAYERSGDIIEDPEIKFATSKGKIEGLFQFVPETPDHEEVSRLDEGDEIEKAIYAAVGHDEFAANKMNYTKKAINPYLSDNEFNAQSQIKSSLVSEDTSVDTSKNQETSETLLGLKFNQEKEDSWPSDK